MESLPAAIAARQKQLEALDRQRDTLQQDIAALARAATILGVSKPEAIEHISPLRLNPARRPGKPMGAISQQWRAILGYLASSGPTHTLADIKAAAELHGVPAEMSTIRDRARNLLKSDYLTKQDNGTFAVTAQAITRFGLLREPPREMSPASVVHMERSEPQEIEPPSA